MKGLIIKDYFYLKRQLKTFFALIVFYIILSVMMKNTSVLSAMVVAFSAILPVTTMSLDEYNKWERLGLAMPLTRKDIVSGKYLLGILIITASAFVILPMSLLVNFFSGTPFAIIEHLCETLLCAGAGITLLSILLPLIFKFGVEKARIIMLIIFMLPAFFGMIFSKVIKNAMSLLPITVPTIGITALLLTLLCFLFLTISFFITVRIYQKKEI